MAATDSLPPPPAYDMAAAIDVKLITDPSGKEVLITVVPPTAPTHGDEKADVKSKRAPVDFVLTIDVSGSMGTSAPAPGENENTGLSVLDVVKHAAKTIVVTMRPDDRVAIVTFSSNADVVLPLTGTGEAGKKRALDLLDGLALGDSTNLWEGLKTSMNILTGDTAGGDGSGSGGALAGLLKASNSIATSFAGLKARGSKSEGQSSSATTVATANEGTGSRLSSIFLLTDGLPNVVPPRGHIPMLKRYLESHPPEKTHFTINTFGFGYSLDSPLLHQIAKIGNGHFGFIPDSGMVGTVFVHAVANTYATYAEGLYVDVEVDDEAVAKAIEVTGALDVVKSSWGVQIPLGAMQYGQTKDIVLKLPKSLSKSPLTVTARCHPWDSNEQVRASRIISDTYIPVADSPIDPNLLYQSYRSDFVSKALALSPWQEKEEDSYKRAQRGQAVPIGAENNFKELVHKIRASFPDATSAATGSSSPASDAHDLVADIEGQVLLGVKDNTAYGRWGRHYLLSLSRSHQRQQCGNFKDAGLLVYGRDSPLFIAARDEIDKAFDDLPPPKPKAQVYGHGGPAVGYGMAAPRAPGAPAPAGARSAMFSAPKSMSVYNSRAAPCFSGNSIVDLADGAKTTVDDLRIGTLVKTPTGAAKVVGIVKTVIAAGELEMCELSNELSITPWHPVDVEGWTFPADIVEPKLTKCDAVFSLVLEENEEAEAHAVYIGGVRCVTLGHGVVDGDVRAHPFLSNHKAVVHELVRAPGVGMVKQATGIERDAESGLMCGFAWSEQFVPAVAVTVGQEALGVVAAVV